MARQNPKDRLLEFLKRSQKDDGSFDGLTADDSGGFALAQNRPSIFITALVANCMAQSDHEAAQHLRRRAAKFLLTQKSDSWSWNYWRRDFAKSKTIPDDWDDTAVALAAIANIKYHPPTPSYIGGGAAPEILDENAMVSVINNLIACEISAGGPYNTWIVSDWKNSAWHDVDVAVNANIANLLVKLGMCPPQLVVWLDEQILNNNFSSKYYSEIEILYFLSKEYRGNASAKLQKRIARTLRRKNNPLETALLVSSLLRLGASPKAVAEEVSLLEKYACGEISAFSFFTEEIVGGVPHGAGSPALTAAFILESLEIFERAEKQEVKRAAARSAAALADKISNRAIRRFKNLPELHQVAKSLVSKLATKDPSREIALLPFWFAKSLKKKNVSKDFLEELGAINILGWIGYTIVDQLLDGEDRKALLPVANICIREVSVAFEKMAPDKKSQEMISAILDTIDQTNSWEHHSCTIVIKNGGFEIPKTLPGYKNNIRLAEKSLGHALGPMAVVLKSGLPNKVRCARRVQEFFTQYLIARQLNDDAHDWLDDLKRGFLNGASVHLIKSWKKKFPSRQEISKETDWEDLQKLFWEEVIDVVAGQIITHTKRARKELAQMKFLQNTQALANLLIPLENSARMAIAERDRTKRFLLAYRKK